MNELRFKIDKSDVQDGVFDYLAKRITAIVDSTVNEAPCVTQVDEKTYQLGAGGNWRLLIHAEDEFSITNHREYGDSPVMKALGEFLSQILVLGWLNRPITASQRILSIMGGEVLLGEKTSFEYSWYCGDEQLKSTADVFVGGGHDYRGQFHPNGICEGRNICLYCGTIIHNPHKKTSG